MYGLTRGVDRTAGGTPEEQPFSPRGVERRPT
jgi:hypothetical protein